MDGVWPSHLLCRSLCGLEQVSELLQTSSSSLNSFLKVYHGVCENVNQLWLAT